MISDHWPLLHLSLRTPRLELRLPDEPQLAALADLAAQGIHEPDRMPFIIPWTDQPPAERARGVVQHHWLRRGTWTPADWALNLVVLLDGRVVGLQTLAAKDFGTLREVNSASWLGLRHQGQGIGTEMRAAVLELAFAGLGAREAVSGAFEDNETSYAVSLKNGYQPDGIERLTVRGRVVTTRRLRLIRERWAERQRPPVTVSGLDQGCLELFGAA